jgi:hypothetical protein
MLGSPGFHRKRACTPRSMKLAEVAGPVRDLLRADGVAGEFGIGEERKAVQQVIEAFRRDAAARPD